MSKEEHKSNLKPWFWLSSSGLKATSESIISPFLPLYGVYLGANPAQIGLLVSITSLLSIVQIFWARLSDKVKNARLIAILANYFASIFNFFFVIMKRLALFVSFRGVQSLVSSAAVPTSAVILAERTQTKDWPYWNSVGQMFIVGGTLIGMLLGGFFLSKFSEDIGFMIIFLGAGAISILAAVLFHIAVPKKQDLEKRKKWFHVEEVSVTLDNTLAVMKTDKNFIWFALASFIFTFGVNFSAPFYIVYNINDYNLGIFQTAILSSIGLIPQIVFSFLTIKLINKWRSKEVLIIGGILTSFFPIAFLIPSAMGVENNILIILICLWAVNGIFWGIINPSLSTLMLDVIHPRRRSLQIAMVNSFNAIALFIAPILGGISIPKYILEGSLPPENGVFIYTIFIVSAVFRLTGILMFIIVKEPIIGGTILRPINKVLNIYIRSNIERAVSTLVTSSEKIARRRKDVRTYSKEKTT